jgi:hypothetical protein
MAVRLQSAAAGDDDTAVLAAADTWAQALETALQCEMTGALSEIAEERLKSAIQELYDAISSRRFGRLKLEESAAYQYQN